MPTEIQIPSILITGLQVILAFAGAFFLALWISLIIWTFRDARLRSRDIFAILLATLMATIFGPLGVILYFLLRPPTTLAELYERSLEEEALLQDLEERPHCPGCSRQVADSWIVCPDCHTSLKKNCVHCGKGLDLNWNICPFCGTHVHEVGPGLDDYHHPGSVEFEAQPVAVAEPVLVPEPEVVTGEPEPKPAGQAGTDTRPVLVPPPPAEEIEGQEAKPTYTPDKTRPHLPEAGTI
jgi:hypothetical protein